MQNSSLCIFHVGWSVYLCCGVCFAGKMSLFHERRISLVNRSSVCPCLTVQLRCPHFTSFYQFNKHPFTHIPSANQCKYNILLTLQQLGSISQNSTLTRTPKIRTTRTQSSITHETLHKALLFTRQWNTCLLRGDWATPSLTLQASTLPSVHWQHRVHGHTGATTCNSRRKMYEVVTVSLVLPHLVREDNICIFLHWNYTCHS